MCAAITRCGRANEIEQAATNDAFDLLHTIVRKRLGRGRLTAIDATNVQPEARKSLVELAREYHVLSAILLSVLTEYDPPNS